MQCPRCSTGVATDVARCPECEAPVGQIRAVAAEWTCPRCDVAVSPADPVCDDCGLKVGKLRDRLDLPSDSSPGGGTGTRDSSDGAEPSAAGDPDRPPDESAGQAGYDGDTSASRAGAGSDQRTGTGPDQRTGTGPDQRTGTGPDRQTGTGHDPNTGVAGSQPDQSPGSAGPQPTRSAEDAGYQPTQPTGNAGQQSNQPTRDVGQRPRQPAGAPGTQPQQPAGSTGHRPQHPAGDPEQAAGRQATQRRGRGPEALAGTRRRTGTGTGGFFEGIPVARAAGLGVLAYLANFVVTYLLAASEFGDEAFANTTMSEFEAVGWLFYGGHNVAIQGLDALGTEDVNFLHLVYSEGFPLHGAAVPQETFYVVPMAGLYLVALACVRWLGPTDPDLSAVDAAKVGLPVAAGYATVALFGAVTVFSLSSNGQTFQPTPSLTLVFMGVLYPAVLGGLGGVIGSR